MERSKGLFGSVANNPVEKNAMFAVRTDYKCSSLQLAIKLYSNSFPETDSN